MIEQSVVIFTVHKAASSLIYKVLTNISEKHPIPLYSPNAPADSKYHLPDVRTNGTTLGLTLNEQPCMVGPIRRPCEVADLPRPRRFVHLRDPRDIMTSMYFSWTYSHKGIPEHLRQKWRDMGIDRFVLEMSDDMLERITTYCNWMEEDPDISFSTYEELFDDYQGWLTNLFNVIGIEDRNLTESIATRSDPKRIAKLGEDPNRHTRQAKPGDHRDKLTPATISALTDKFSRYFQFLETRQSLGST